MTEEQCPHTGQWAVSQPSVVIDHERGRPQSIHCVRICRLCGKIDFLAAAFMGDAEPSGADEPPGGEREPRGAD